MFRNLLVLLILATLTACQPTAEPPTDEPTSAPMSEEEALIARAAFPFFVLMGVAGIIVTIFPGIALWLPGVLFGG